MLRDTVRASWDSKIKYHLNSALFALPSCLHSTCLDVDGNGYITAKEMGEVFKEAMCPIPGYKMRELIKKLDKDNDSKITFEEFKAVGNTNKLTN